MHEDIKQTLKGLVNEERIPHAILFTESSGNGAVEIALDFIQYIFCKDRKELTSCGVCNSCHMVQHLAHPDLHFAFPTNSASGQSKKGSVEEYYPAWRELLVKNKFFGEQDLYDALGIDNKAGTISVSDASDIMRKLSLASYEGGAKVMFIMFPEKMNIEAANKLLKSLEEPQPETYFIMISHSPQKLLSTILSRCLRIEVPPATSKEISEILVNKYKCNEEYAIIASKSACGSIGKALSIYKDINNDSEEKGIFTSLLLSACNEGLYNTLLLGEELAGIGRERLKAVLTDGLECIRKLLMINIGLADISFAQEKEIIEFSKLKNRLNKVDFKHIYNYTDSAIRLIDRNVNAKFVMADLCNRIYFKFNKPS